LWYFELTPTLFFFAFFRYAQFLIGVHYERGFDIAQDFEKAKYYYGKSADQGFADAQAALGIKLIAEAQYAQGIEWLHKAVEKVK
jgi:Flp pilus assembly protein TadD